MNVMMQNRHYKECLAGDTAANILLEHLDPIKRRLLFLKKHRLFVKRLSIISTNSYASLF